jgi:hypothetical protein
MPSPSIKWDCPKRILSVKSGSCGPFSTVVVLRLVVLSLLLFDPVGFKDGNETFQAMAMDMDMEGTCQLQAYFTGLRFDHFGRGSDAVAFKCPYMTFGMDTWCGCPPETVSLPECTLRGGYKNTKRRPDPVTAIHNFGLWDLSIL